LLEGEGSLDGLEGVDATVTVVEVGEGVPCNTTAGGGTGGLLEGGGVCVGDDDVVDLVVGEVGVGVEHEGNDTGNVGAGHGGARDGVVCRVSGVPGGADGDTGGGDLGLLAADAGAGTAGPREEKEARVSVASEAATEMTLLLSAGEFAVEQLGPEFPAEKTGMMPAASQEVMTPWYQVSPWPPPHELLMTWGAFVQSGLRPSARVGQARNSPEPRRSEVEHETEPQPLPAIQTEAGATPTPEASEPAMVPMVCVPWPLPSEGEAVAWRVLSYQL